MHYRQRIRDAVKTLLTAASTDAGANVFTSRARPVLEILQRREMVLSIYTADETSTQNNDGHHLERTLTVSIEGMAGGGDDLDDILDTLAEQVEAAIEADTTLGTLLSQELELESTSSEITARGNQQVGAFRMDYTCSYITEPATNPDDELWPEQPIPTEVNTSMRPSADAYVLGNGLAEAKPPEIVPVTIDVVSPSQPPETTPNPCKDTGSCDIGAWQGDPE